MDLEKEIRCLNNMNATLVAQIERLEGKPFTNADWRKAMHEMLTEFADATLEYGVMVHAKPLSEPPVVGGTARSYEAQDE